MLVRLGRRVGLVEVVFGLVLVSVFGGGLLVELFQFGLQLAEFRVVFDAFDLPADSRFLFP